MLNSYTMNLFIQTVINGLIDKNHKIKRNEVEHYEDICFKNETYMLKSKKAGLTINKKTYNTLEDYLLKTKKDIDVDKVVGWLEEVFTILDKLYDVIQFHHCDAKAAQILLLSDGRAMVADLDKVTFTLNINNVPHRFLLGYKNNFINKNIKLIGNILDLDEITKMRFDKYPRKNCIYEKYCFLSSVCLLTSSKSISDEISRKCIKIINKQARYRNEKICVGLNIPDNFDFTINNIKSKRSLTTPVSFVTLSDCFKTSMFNKKLKSVAHLKKNQIIIK